MPPGMQGNQAVSSISPRYPPDSPRQDSTTSSAHANAATSPSAAEQAVESLWKKIEDHRATAPRTTYFKKNVVRPNFTGVLCPDNIHTVKVRMGQSKDPGTPLHANYVHLGKCYAVGQSPEGKFEDTCLRDLIHSLDSGQGLFQFTSRNAHRVDIGADNPSAHPTIAHMMAVQWKQHGQAMRLGDRYAIENFCVVPNNPPQPNVTRYAITACEIKNGVPDPNTRKTVHITQAGLRFVNKLLEPEEIVQAAKLFATHPPPVMPEGDEAEAQTRSQRPPQTGPLICSAAGIGRSAVLAVYQDLSSRLSTDVNRSNLDQKLEEAIKNGIDARGPKFLHSKAQLAALREALLGPLAKKSSARRSTSAEHGMRNRFFPLGNDLRADLDAPSHARDRLSSHDLSGQESVRVSHQNRGLQSAQQSGSRSDPRLKQHVGLPADQLSTPAHRQNPPAQPRTLAGCEGDANIQSNNPVKAAPSVLPNPASRPMLTTSDATITRLPEHALVVVKADGDCNTASTPGSPQVQPADPKFAPANSQIFKVNWPQWGAPPQHGSFKPYYRSVDYLDALRTANQMRLPSIVFSAELIAMEQTDLDDASPATATPVARAAALAIATAARYIGQMATTLKYATFQCANETQKKVYEHLLKQVDMLTHYRVTDALLRPPIRDPSQATAPEKFFENGEIATYVPPEINSAADNLAAIITPPATPQGILHTVRFAPWIDAPSAVQAWNDVSTTVQAWNAAGGGDAPGFVEPAATQDLHAAGAVIVEKDGRVWVVAPSNHFDNLNHTFPHGQIGDLGLTARGCAVKKAHEESGLQIRLTQHLTDSRNGSTRYYLAERIGGTPADVGWESQAVSLVPQFELEKMFDDTDGGYNHQRERHVANALQRLASPSTVETRSSGLDFSEINRTNMPDLSALIKLVEEDDGVKEFTDKLNAHIQSAMAPVSISNPIKPNRESAVGDAKSLSLRIKHVVEGWRDKNCELIKNSGGSNTSDANVLARVQSYPPHKCTILASVGESANPYLHANYIPLDSRIAFIAAQRPRSNKTGDIDNSNNFWQTLLHEKVALIVDLTEADEKPQEVPYGPSDNVVKHIGTHTLRLTSDTTPSPQLRNEQIDVRDARNQPSGTLTRLHFTGWKEKKAISADTLITLADQVVKASGERPGRVLIHGSHGVGRTGTLITFITASEMLDKALQKQRVMPIAELTQLVTEIVVRGCIERGPHFVSDGQFSLVIEALVRKHFDRAGNEFLIRKKSATLLIETEFDLNII